MTKMRTRFLVLGMAILGMFVYSCGGSGSSSNTSGSLDQACSDLANAECQKVNSCSSFLLKFLYGNIATCEARDKLGCMAGISADGVTVTPSQIEACVSATSAKSCSDVWALKDACHLNGSLPDGSACGSGNQCQSGYCKIPWGKTCGVCTAKATAGANCMSVWECASGLICAGGQCKTPGAAGALCSDSQPCRSDLYCNNGTCAKPATSAGTPCDSSILTSCSIISGLYCPESGVCKNIQLVPGGSSCGLGTSCEGGGVCKQKSPDALSGTCVSPVADGQHCDASQSLYCMSPATCVSGQCVLPNPPACN